MRALARLATVLVLALAVIPAVAAAEPPIVFVHGNGDSAALWHTTIWRFESNGYPRALLFALDFPHPAARSDDTKPQPNRSGSAEQRAYLGQTVETILRQTGQEKVVLVGSSRGGNAIRDYIKNGGGASRVSRAILCGTPNHGVAAQPTTYSPANEFNGSGPFLSGLNAEHDEVHPGVTFLTLRSDANDKYAQPEGRWIGLPGKPTNVTYAGPELRGAASVVLPGLDHREVAFHRLAFWPMYRFVTGRDPATLDVLPEPRPVLDGLVSGTEAGAPTNLPLPGAIVEIYEVDRTSGRRLGDAVHRRTTGPDGRWGPFAAHPATYYEFVVSAAGYPLTRVYRTPFPRSTTYAHLRLRPLGRGEDGPGSLVVLARPRGYLALGRDRAVLDGQPAPGIASGVPGVAEARQRFPSAGRAVPVAVNGEALTVVTGADDVVIAEFHY